MESEALDLPLWRRPPQAPSLISRRWISGEQISEISRWLEGRGCWLMLEHHGGSYVAIVRANEVCPIGLHVPEPKRRKKL